MVMFAFDLREVYAMDKIHVLIIEDEKDTANFFNFGNYSGIKPVEH